MSSIDISQVTDIEIEGADPGDISDLSDAYIAAANWKNTGAPLDDQQLEDLTASNREYVYEAAMRSIVEA